MSESGVRDYDVLIVGAGLPGLALALALRNSGLTVGLVDRRLPIAGSSVEWDSRIYAISPGNARLLHELGVWSRIDPERMAAMESMRVLGDQLGTQLDFSAFDSGERALAWLVEQQALMTATLAAWMAGDLETIHIESPPEALSREVDRIAVRLADGPVLSAKLLVGADGLQSWVREQSGIHSERRSYGQSGVVANFETERPHHGRAWQWFRPDGGVLAWLPLPGRRMSIVWSSPQPAADELLGLDDAAFAAAVQVAGGQALGQLSLITPRASFPLSFVRPASPIANRIALIGDAAHGVHPLAGQGLNLGYGDVGALGAVLRDRGPVGDPGSGLLLGRYARERAWPTRSMQAVTDGLWRLFNAENPVSATLRNRGMSALNRFPAVKAILMQPAMR